MPNEPDPKQPAKKARWGKPVNDGFVVFEVDGFAQLTPEQKTWPIVPARRGKQIKDGELPTTETPPPSE